MPNFCQNIAVGNFWKKQKKYALNFDGVNDDVEFSTWTNLTTNNPFSIFMFLKVDSTPSERFTIFLEGTPNLGGVGSDIITVLFNNSNEIIFILRKSNSIDDLLVKTNVTSFLGNYITLQFVYGGDLNTAKIYVNGLDATTVIRNTLTTNFSTSGNLKIGGNYADFVTNKPDMVLRKYQIVDVAKNDLQALADHNALQQSLHGGTRLLDLQPQYWANLQGQINTLDSTATFTEESPNAYDYNLLGYNPTLVLGTDLIQFEP